MNTKQFIFFSLHTHILQFTKTEAEVGDVLLRHGVRPISLRPLKCTCNLLQNFQDISRNDTFYCEKCFCINNLLKQTLKGWDVFFLSDWAQTNDFVVAENEVKKIEKHNFQEYAFLGIPIGMSAIHDVVLEFKIDDLDFYKRPDAWEMYLSIIRGSILCLIWFDRFLNDKKINGLMTYNSNYSLNRIISLDCDKRNISRFSMHGGPSLAAVWDTLMLTRGDIENYRIACVKNWQKSYYSRVCSQDDVNKVSEHFKELFAGKKAHAYSSPAGSVSNRDIFKWIHANKRKTLLLSLSSSDERIAIESSGIRESHSSEKFVFPTQYDLIDFLIEKVKFNPDIQLIIRVHPREFPNKRENKLSSNAIKLKKVLSNVPENVLVNWPEDNVSFYDLIHHVELVLTAWSTTLLEASLFGCPIVLPFNPTQYYDVLSDSISHTSEEYWTSILFYIDQKWTIERSVQTFRWYWISQFGGAVYLNSSSQRLPSFSEIIIYTISKIVKKIPLLAQLYSNPIDAFHGSYSELVQRRINFPGKRPIVKTLLSDFDPLCDFTLLQKMQFSDTESNSLFYSSKDEYLAVHKSLCGLSGFYSQTKRSDKNSHYSKVYQMLDSSKT